MDVDEAELRAESDATLAALETIRQLEERKRRLAPEGEEFLAAARQVRELTEILMETVTRQEELAEAVADPTRRPDPDRPIDEIPPPGKLPAILGAWRNAERRLAEAVPGSRDERELQNEVERLRRAYSDAHTRFTRGGSSVG